VPATHTFTPIDVAFLEVELAVGFVLVLDQDAGARHSRDSRSPPQENLFAPSVLPHGGKNGAA
jgi:hypothetical protein